MRLLIDTHIVLWALFDSPKLPPAAQGPLSNPENDVYYSAVSIWELAIKHALRPTEIPYPPARVAKLCDLAGFDQLPVRAEHAVMLDTLRRDPAVAPHKDPFDRMLIAQAKTEGMTFLTHDHLLPAYGEPCIMLV